MVDPDEIRNTELFTSLTDEEIARLVDVAKPIDLVRNDLLFTEGDHADSLYVVRSGRMAMARESFDGRESVLALMEPGDLFGEMPLFDGQARSTDARALEATTVVGVSYEAVRALYDERPELLWNVVSLITTRLRLMDDALADAMFLDVPGRTAKRLLELSGDQDEFSLPVTQEELAGMVGASRERVNKALASFVKLGWIAHEDNTYTILRREDLALRSR